MNQKSSTKRQKPQKERKVQVEKYNYLTIKFSRELQNHTCHAEERTSDLKDRTFEMTQSEEKKKKKLKRAKKV